MPDQTQITVRDNPEEQRFEALDDSGKLLAISTYRRYDDRIVFVHTEVDDGAEGQGVGSDLVRTALDQVREEGLRVVAQCPFVKEWIRRHPDYAISAVGRSSRARIRPSATLTTNSATIGAGCRLGRASRSPRRSPGRRWRSALPDHPPAPRRQRSLPCRRP